MRREQWSGREPNGSQDQTGGDGGYRGGQQGGGGHGRAVVTTAAVVAMTPEAVEAAVAAEVAWAEVTVVASINLVALRTKDHIMTLNRQF